MAIVKEYLRQRISAALLKIRSDIANTEGAIDHKERARRSFGATIRTMGFGGTEYLHSRLASLRQRERELEAELEIEPWPLLKKRMLSLAGQYLPSKSQPLHQK